MVVEWFLVGAVIGSILLYAMHERRKRKEAESKMLREERMSEALGRTLAQCRSRLEEAQMELRDAGLLGEAAPRSTIRTKDPVERGEK